MSQIEKLLKKFISSPHTVAYKDIERLLRHANFERIQAKGSHVKWKHSHRRSDIIVPVHKNDCKPFYKKMIAEIIRDIHNP